MTSGKPVYINPEKHSDGSYTWDALEVRDAGKKGKGLFATRDIPMGTRIKMFGEYLDETQYKDLEKESKSNPDVLKYLARTGLPNVWLNADPRIHPDKHGVGGNGLYIAAFVNEANPDEKVNAVLAEGPDSAPNYVLIQNVQKDEEIRTNYGKNFERKYPVADYPTIPEWVWNQISKTQVGKTGKGYYSSVTTKREELPRYKAKNSYKTVTLYGLSSKPTVRFLKAPSIPGGVLIPLRDLALASGGTEKSYSSMINSRYILLRDIYVTKANTPNLKSNQPLVVTTYAGAMQFARRSGETFKNVFSKALNDFLGVEEAKSKLAEIAAGGGGEQQEEVSPLLQQWME